MEVIGDRISVNYSKECMATYRHKWYLTPPMSKTQQQLQQFESLANKFETLAGEMRTCHNPKRRIELLQRMKILIDQIDGQILTSLNQENKKDRLANPNLVPQESAS